MLSKLWDWLQLTFIWSSPERALWLYRLVPKHLVEGLRVGNLNTVIRHVIKNSVFYGNRLDASLAQKEIKDPKELGNFYTTPADLQKNPFSHFLCESPQTAFETTGTVSKNSKRVLFSNREIEDAGRVGAVGLWSIGIRPTDRVASSFDYSFWVSGPTLKASLAEMGAFHIEAGRISPEEFYERIRPYGCNVIVADPGWLVALSHVAEKRGPWLMKLIMIGGENLSEESRRYIEKIWQCPVLLTYGQTEAFGMIGVECQYQNGYHVNDMDLWVEILNPDKDGYGELCYTTLRRTVMPFVRYRSGDVTKLLTDPCPCGQTSVRLAKLRGRVDEMVVTGVGNIAGWMFEPVLSGFEPRIEAWQFHITRNALSDVLELRLEVNDAVNENSMRDQILDRMKEKMPIAHGGILQNLAEFKVKCVKPGSLKGDARKLRQLVDHRNFDLSQAHSAVS